MYLHHCPSLLVVVCLFHHLSELSIICPNFPSFVRLFYHLLNFHHRVFHHLPEFFSISTTFPSTTVFLSFVRTFHHLFDFLIICPSFPSFVTFPYIIDFSIIYPNFSPLVPSFHQRRYFLHLSKPKSIYCPIFLSFVRLLHNFFDFSIICRFALTAPLFYIGPCFPIIFLSSCIRFFSVRCRCYHKSVFLYDLHSILH